MEERITYYLILCANPLSDSNAARMIFNTIASLDIISCDLKVFLPGFSGSANKTYDSKEQVTANVEQLKKYNEIHHGDYHGTNAIYHTTCPSVGDMYFNDADFAYFMLDLERKCTHFKYNGKTQMVILPAQKGMPLYNAARCLDLEPFFYNLSNTTCSLQEFLMSAFDILQNNDNRHSIDCIFSILAFYHNHIHGSEFIDSSDVTITIDNEILKHLQWKEVEEAFFISYSSKDKLSAFALKTLLERNNKLVWIAPDGIPSSYDYATVIPAAVRITTRFVVLLSHNSVKSGWVRREIEKAINVGRKIDGVFLDGLDMDTLNKEYDNIAFLLSCNQMKYTINDLFNNREKLDEFLLI